MESRWTQQKQVPPQPRTMGYLLLVHVTLWKFCDWSKWVLCKWSSYLWICQSPQIRVKVELDADSSARKGESSDQQHNQHHVGEGRSEVDHLYRHTHMCKQETCQNNHHMTSITYPRAASESPSHPPFLWISPPSRCRSSTWPRRWTDTGPGPHSASPFGQYLGKSLVLSSYWNGGKKHTSDKPSKSLSHYLLFIEGATTHSQNSMTGEVVFGLIIWSVEVFLLWNSTQFSVGEKPHRNYLPLHYKKGKNTF